MAESKKICPLMSTGADVKYCDDSCKFYVRYFDEKQGKSLSNCAFLFVAESIIHKDLY